jgi:hypothetical protein
MELEKVQTAANHGDDKGSQGVCRECYLMRDAERRWTSGRCDPEVRGYLAFHFSANPRAGQGIGVDASIDREFQEPDNRFMYSRYAFVMLHSQLLSLTGDATCCSCVGNLCLMARPNTRCTLFGDRVNCVGT